MRHPGSQRLMGTNPTAELDGPSECMVRHELKKRGDSSASFPIRADFEQAEISLVEAVSTSTQIRSLRFQPLHGAYLQVIAVRETREIPVRSAV